MTHESYTGLTTAQVEESRREHGINVLTPARRTSWLGLLLQKFKDPLIIILLIAGALSVGISIYEYSGLGKSVEVFFEPAGIFAAIILATGLGFIFEHKAEKEFALLTQVSDDEPVEVIRDGNPMSVPRRDVVVGDIVVLPTGCEIPADGILLSSTFLSVDESTLTGEPICHKDADPEKADPQATYPTDVVLRGTKVMEGHGVARITAVGDRTENGKVFVAAQIDNSVRTPLNEQLDRLGHLISVSSYVIGALVIAGRLLMYFSGTPVWNLMDFLAYLLQSVMLAVTLVVVSVPEGLPMAVTLSLAYSMRRMLRTGNLVRRLHACETMGAVTTICTDKTGTLTANQMRVADTVFFDRPGSDSSDLEPVMTMMALNSTAELDMRDASKPSVVGNPTEGALLLWIASQGGDYRKLRGQWRRTAEIPFTTERKYMASVIENPDGRRMLVVKGAPEIVYNMCHGAEHTPNQTDIDRLLLDYQQRAMRTLGFAYRELQAGEKGIESNEITGVPLHFCAVVAISDPVREDVPDAVRACLDAGIKVKIVTGDTPATAREIGRRIGLWSDSDTDRNIITGAEIESLSDDELRDRVEDFKIIARARPMDKKRLVEALQSRGEVVAVTGDGTNDAPALKAAHVGLSMGDGTSVAKEASDITILNNSFSGITNAVMWGRSLYRNIQRFILFQLTVNVAACLTVLTGSFMGTDAPLTVTQMLWVNLIMDTFAAMALASLPPSPSVLLAKPRSRRSFIITPAMGRFICGVGFIFFALMLGLLYVMEHAPINSIGELLHPVLGSHRGLTPYELSVFFTTFVMLQVWNLFNARAFGSDSSGLDLRHCGEFIFITAVVAIGQVIIVTIGGAFFNVVPLDSPTWALIVGATLPVLLIGEGARAAHRYLRKRRA